MLAMSKRHLYAVNRWRRQSIGTRNRIHYMCISILLMCCNWKRHMATSLMSHRGKHNMRQRAMRQRSTKMSNGDKPMQRQSKDPRVVKSCQMWPPHRHHHHQFHRNQLQRLQPQHHRQQQQQQQPSQLLQLGRRANQASSPHQLAQHRCVP